MQNLQQTYTVKDVPTKRHSMKCKIANAFQKEKKLGNLILKATREHSLINFVGLIPVMSSKAVTFEGITHGFLEGGYIDKKSI